MRLALFARRLVQLLLLLCAVVLSQRSHVLASSISVIEIPLREVVASARFIVFAKLEQIASVAYPNAKEDEPELRVLDLRIEEVLKPRAGDAAVVKGATIQAFDPRDKYQHDHYEAIQAGAMSFAEKRYATKAGTLAEGDHLIFFLNEEPPADNFPLPHPYVLAAGQAYDLVAAKAAVMQLVK